MRPTERIDNFLNKVNWLELQERWNITDSNFYQLNDLKSDHTIYTNFIQYWKENLDQRVGQVLINLDILPDKIDIWTDEEEDILIDQGIAPEECLYWISYYDKDMNRIPEICRFIKDLETDHINSIYIHMFKCNGKLSDKYKNAFRNILISRNESTDVIDFIEQLWKMEVIGE